MWNIGFENVYVVKSRYIKTPLNQTPSIPKSSLSEYGMWSKIDLLFLYK